MLQKPNTVFVSTGTDVDGAAVATGKVYISNPYTGAGVDYTTAIPTALDAIQIAFKTATGVKKTAIIKKDQIKNITANGTCAYVAKTNAETAIDWTGVTLSAGKRYVVRVIYRDIYEHPGQFTHSYEVIATAGETLTTIINKFVTKINAHTGRRVFASAPGGDVLLLAALNVNGPEAGIATKEAITPYSQVQMKVVAYYTDPSSLFSGSYSEIIGLTITNTESKPGKGNPFVVRDREQAALGYKGITYRTEWPVIKPELNVDLSSSYDTLVIEFANSYQSPDNQYVKSTDFVAEVYATAGQGLEAMRDAIATWAGL